MNPIVSIVISVYRRATYLAEAIGSALRQAYEPIEVIVTEDGASPEVKAVVDQMADSRLRFIRNEQPLGAAANKLAAWRSARGEFLVNLDDDDVIDPEFLSVLVPPLIANANATVAFCDHWIIDPHGHRNIAATDANTRRWRRDSILSGYLQPFIEAAVVHKSVPMAMGAVFRRSIIDDFRTESGPSYDTYLAYLACRDGQAAWYTPKRLSSWRVHLNQETAQGGLRMAPANIFVNAQCEADPRLAAYRHLFAQRKYTSHIDFGLNQLRAGQIVEGRRQLRDALHVQFSKRALSGWFISFCPSVIRQPILGRRWRNG